MNIKCLFQVGMVLQKLHVEPVKFISFRNCCAKCEDYEKETFWRHNSSIREYLKKNLIQLKEDYVQVSYISTTWVFKIKAALKACD